VTLEIGDKAPGFRLPADGGKECDLAAYAGKTVVLYFYPRDDTPGCTTEAQGFRDLMPEFENCGAVVIGVSRDTVKKHDRFKEKHDLNFPLISDADGTLCEDYGVWVEKKNYGRTYMGIERSTFLIDGQGKLRQIWRKVRVKGHVDAVLEAVRNL
jgi:peroxiredoxin Q/BCP